MMQQKFLQGFFVLITAFILSGCGNGNVTSGASTLTSDDVILVRLGFVWAPYSQCSRNSLYTWYFEGRKVADHMPFDDSSEAVFFVKIKAEGYQIKVYDETQARGIHGYRSPAYIGAWTDWRSLPKERRVLHFGPPCDTA